VLPRAHSAMHGSGCLFADRVGRARGKRHCRRGRCEKMRPGKLWTRSSVVVRVGSVVGPLGAHQWHLLHRVL